MAVDHNTRTTPAVTPQSLRVPHFPKTGKSKRTVERIVAIANELGEAVLTGIAGTSLELTLFDYAGLPAESAELCRIVEIRIKTRTGMTIVENGQDLIKVKEALEHGKFGELLESWFPLHERTARRWMEAAERYSGKSDIMSVLGATALTMLAAPSTPEPVRQEIERRAVEGGDTSVAEIARLKAEHKAEAERLRAE